MVSENRSTRDQPGDGVSIDGRLADGRRQHVGRVSKRAQKIASDPEPMVRRNARWRGEIPMRGHDENRFNPEPLTSRQCHGISVSNLYVRSVLPGVSGAAATAKAKSRNHVTIHGHIDRLLVPLAHRSKAIPS